MGFITGADNVDVGGATLDTDTGAHACINVGVGILSVDVSGVNAGTGNVGLFSAATVVRPAPANRGGLTIGKILCRIEGAGLGVGIGVPSIYLLCTGWSLIGAVVPKMFLLPIVLLAETPPPDNNLAKALASFAVFISTFTPLRARAALFDDKVV